PNKFSDLVILSGLSHGTDVWAGNAQELVRQGKSISEVIGCRDDIMTYLMDMGLEPKESFVIMEGVRKGKGLTEDQEKIMRAHNVPDWYIQSAKKIKYMFPKAHAVAYVTMAVRLAWYKVHEPLTFYIQYLSLRCTSYEIETMTKGLEAVQYRMNDIYSRLSKFETKNTVSNKEANLFDTLEICEELYARGYKINNVDLYKSKATIFSVDPDDDKALIPPFIVVDKLGESVATSIEEEREKGEFISQDDLLKRTKLSSSLLAELKRLGSLGNLPESNQISLFD
ncbi:MAG: PolC-type DNA polymerase III, partial [Solobacterium sp.]|nr:PolC-type DNA polymerase III [Solobacterium sp.]